MPTSPSNREMEILVIEVSSDGKVIDESYAIVSVDIHREINKVGTAQISFFLENEEEDNTFGLSANKEFDPGKTIEIKLGYDSESGSVFKGIILNHCVKARPGKGILLEISCSEESVKMTLGRKNKYFKDQEDSAIISGIISDSGLQANVDSTTYQHKQLIQYHATNWDFILTRAEQNGLLVYMEDSKLCVKEPEFSTTDLELTYGLDVISFFRFWNANGSPFGKSRYEKLDRCSNVDFPSVAHSWEGFFCRQ